MMLFRAFRRESPVVTTESHETVEVSLLKRRAGCTGMFWRADPTLTAKLENNNNWPRDGAKLRGKVVTVDGAKWLLASEVKNKGHDWVKAPGGAAMPFEYDNHYYLELTKNEVEAARNEKSNKMDSDAKYVLLGIDRESTLGAGQNAKNVRREGNS